MSANGSDSAPPDGGGGKGRSLLTKSSRIGKDNPYDVSTSQDIHAVPKTGEGDSTKPFANVAKFCQISKISA